MNRQGWIDIRGIRFPDDPRILGDRARRDFEEAQSNSGIGRKLVSIVRPHDRVLVAGAGSGLLPALLAGRLGVRHVHVVEPDPARQDYLRRVQQANGLFRISMSEFALQPFDPTFLVADLPETGGRFPRDTVTPGLRGALVRLGDGWETVARAIPALTEAGLHYFPRQSSGDIYCCLRKWN